MFSLVQYFPFKMRIGYCKCFTENESVDKFYDYINANDEYHNSIVFRFDGDWRKIDIKNKLKVEFKNFLEGIELMY